MILKALLPLWLSCAASEATQVELQGEFFYIVKCVRSFKVSAGHARASPLADWRESVVYHA